MLSGAKIMNIMHLKYAVEVEKTRSITQAAKNLFTAQPNLSKAIKELEDTLGITIFKRTSKGISITPRGEEFLFHAKKILSQIEEIEDMYKIGSSNNGKFSISVPRASYIGVAFTEFTKKIDKTKKYELIYKETNGIKTINNIMQSDYRLGILRYPSELESHYKNVLHEKDLSYTKLFEFSYVIATSKNSPLAKLENITKEDLAQFTEIAHSDPFVPAMPMSEVRAAEISDYTDKKIFVFERASQFDILSNSTDTFMWVSPMPKRIMEQYGLIQLKSDLKNKIYHDILIYRRGYKFSELDNMFIEEIEKSKENIKNI